MELFNFAHFLKFEESLRFLGERLSSPEPWTYSNCQKELEEGNNAAQFYMPILRNYLEHTFRNGRPQTILSTGVVFVVNRSDYLKKFIAWLYIDSISSINSLSGSDFPLPVTHSFQ